DKNFWVTVTMGTIARNMELPPPVAGSPGMFRCVAKPGLMKEIFETAGFRNTQQKEVQTKLRSGTKDRYWNMMTEVGAPVVAALSKADEETRIKIRKEVFEQLEQKYPGDVAIDASAIVITAEK